MFHISFLISVQFKCSVVSDSLWLHELQHARPPCPSPTPGVCSNSCPLSWWCHLVLCCPLLLPSIFPSIRVFSNGLLLPIRCPKYCNISFSNRPSSEYSGLISFRIDWFDLLAVRFLAVQGTLKSFSSTTVQKQQFFGSQPSLWSDSHIYAWLLEKL